MFSAGPTSSVDLYARAMQRAEQALLLDPDQPYRALCQGGALIMMKAETERRRVGNVWVIAEAAGSNASRFRSQLFLAGQGAYWSRWPPGNSSSAIMDSRYRVSNRP